MSGSSTQLIRGSNPSYLLEKQVCSLYTNEPGAALCRLIYLRASDEVGEQLARSPAENRTRSTRVKTSRACRYPTGPVVPRGYLKAISIRRAPGFRCRRSRCRLIGASSRISA